MSIVEQSRTQEVFLTDGQNVWFMPIGWCDMWSVAKGFRGGLDYLDDDGQPCPEVFCYCPTHTTPNSEVETMFCAVSELEKLRQVDEDEARRIHPALFQRLDEIDREYP